MAVLPTNIQTGDSGHAGIHNATNTEVNSVNTTLALKADTSAVNTALATKAESATVNSALALKADTSAVESALAAKADAATVTASLAAKADLTIPLVQVTGSTHTIVTSNNGALIRGNSGATQTVTLPNNMPAGFNFTWRQVGLGQASFVAASGATLENVDNQTKTAGSKAMVSLFVDSNGSGTNAAWVLDGRTGA